jgi:lipopolysaccharide/colanic/teichoic acid biosynthesis glycosyltransferase
LRHDSCGTYSRVSEDRGAEFLTHSGQAALGGPCEPGRVHSLRATSPYTQSFRTRETLDRALKRMLDVLVAAPVLLLLAPVILVLAATIKLESRGGAFYRCRRVGWRGRELQMLKFRKMHEGADGPALAHPQDERFTRIGAFLARTKLDELPQLWNVLKGDMSLVGPRPEDPGFVQLHKESYEKILTVRPGITGLSQLAFARESEVLDPEDRVGHYVQRILPQKIRMDGLYATQRSLSMDMKILWWTARAVVGRRDVAVHRDTGRLSRRAPRQPRREAGAQAVQLERQAS